MKIKKINIDKKTSKRIEKIAKEKSKRNLASSNQAPIEIKNLIETE